MTFLLEAKRLDRDEIVRALQRGVAENDGSTSWRGLAVLALAVGLLALILLGIAALQNRDKRPPIRNAEKLHTSLLSRLPLRPLDQRVLRRLARELELPQPAGILISPRLFDEAVSRWTEVMDKERADRYRKHLEEIRGRLFRPSS